MDSDKPPDVINDTSGEDISPKSFDDIANKKIKTIVARKIKRIIADKPYPEVKSFLNKWRYHNVTDRDVRSLQSLIYSKGRVDNGDFDNAIEQGTSTVVSILNKMVNHAKVNVIESSMRTLYETGNLFNK